ncbi:MAG TPA: FIST N-terminal domain-containing protein [Kofleriaceae bacterium]|nr:FIST N-terminal domain-containing protein [Kofleriaceae bacterium]
MARIDFRSARTAKQDAEGAANDLVEQLGGVAPKLVTLFAARSYDHDALNKAVRARLPRGTRLIGASTGGEIDRKGRTDGQVVLGAFSGDFDVGIGIGHGLSKDAMSAGSNAMLQACEQLGTKAKDLSTDKHVGVVIDDGFRYKKEELLLGMLERNPDVLLVGGGATDASHDPSVTTALIHVDGEVSTDATLVAMFRTGAPFAALRAHWYEPTGDTLAITKIDESHQRALEIDGKPAAARYAELIGVPIDQLDFTQPTGFASRPTALKVGKEYFLRAPWKPLPDGSILFANMLEEGAELEVMKLGDIAGATRRFFTEAMPSRVPNPTAALLFHCGARSWLARSMGKSEELDATFAAAPPCVGFDVHFEIYCGFHINTTLTSLVFGNTP